MNNEGFLLYIEGGVKLRHLLTFQITHLEVRIRDRERELLPAGGPLGIFTYVLTMGECLTNLTFSLWWIDEGREFSFLRRPSMVCESSSLTKLVITVYNFDDCLYLLDGRLKHLSTLIIDIKKLRNPLPDIDNTVSRNVIIHNKILMIV
jgi:hypothetical protein